MSTSEIIEESQLQTDPEFIPTRNYTSYSEKNLWWYIARVQQDNKCSYKRPDYISTQAFRTRRSRDGFFWWGPKFWTNALRTSIGNSDDVGTFIKLTNSYLLVTDGVECENFSKTAKDDLPEIPVIKTSLAGCRVIGRMCVGNKHGLLVPETIYDTELQHIEEELPNSVQITKLDDRLSALGNVIACNDRIALIHPELDKASEEIIENTLQVEVFRHVIANNSLVGSYCVLNSNGGLVSTDIAKDELEDLSSVLQLSLIPGTVNSGNKVVASGLVANDSIAYAGMKTSGREFTCIEQAFHFKVHMDN